MDFIAVKFIIEKIFYFIEKHVEDINEIKIKRMVGSSKIPGKSDYF